MAKKTYSTTIFRDDSACYIPVEFDPAAVFGKVRAPVVVTLNGYSFRSTIFSMGGEMFIPLRKSNREAAKLVGGETLKVTVELDEAKREVDCPPDLKKALRAAKAWASWEKLSYTHQREHVEAIAGAKKPETRTRRIAAAVAMVSAR